MKKVTALLALVGTLTFGLAADATIDAQIEAIQSAPAQERVRLMNEFKEQLMTMNQEERQEAIAALQAEIQATGEMTKTQTRDRKQLRIDQAEATGDMVRTQQMNQKQIGNQVAKDFINATGVNPNGGNGGEHQRVKIPTP